MIYESKFLVRTSFLESCAHAIGYCDTYSEAWVIASTLDPDRADSLIVEIPHLVLLPVEVDSESD